MTTQHPESHDASLHVSADDAPQSYAAQEAPRRVRRRYVTIGVGVAAVVALAAAVAGTLGPRPAPPASAPVKKEIMAEAAPARATAPVESLTMAEAKPGAMSTAQSAPPVSMEVPVLPAAPPSPQSVDAAMAAEAAAVAPAAGSAQTAMLTDGPPPTPSTVIAAPVAASPVVEPPPPVRQAAAAAAQKVQGTAVPAIGGDFAVQFAAVSSVKRAQQEAGRLQKQLAAVLGGRAVRVLKAELKGKGTVYRIRAEGFKTRQMAQDACRAAAQLKVPTCVATRR